MLRPYRSYTRSGPEATLMSTWNFQIFPIFRDATARNGDALFFQHLSNLLVGQGVPRIFVLDVPLDLALDNQQRRSVPHWTIYCFGKKEPQLEHTLGRVREFVGDGPADGRWMHADFLSDIFDHHRLQLIYPFIEKLRLAPDNCLTNFDDNVFALLNVLQKLYCRLKAVFDVILHFLVQSVPLEHVAVGGA